MRILVLLAVLGLGGASAFADEVATNSTTTNAATGVNSIAAADAALATPPASVAAAPAAVAPTPPPAPDTTAPATAPGNQGYVQGSAPAADNSSATTADDNGDHPLGDLFRVLNRWDAWIRQNLW